LKNTNYETLLHAISLSLLRPYITLHPGLRLHSSLMVRDQVSQPYKSTGKVTFPVLQATTLCAAKQCNGFIVD